MSSGGKRKGAGRPPSPKYLCPSCGVQRLHSSFLLTDGVSPVCEHCRPQGGKRPGAGRPRADTENVWLKIRTKTLKRLRAMIPTGKRSEFVSDCIDVHL